MPGFSQDWPTLMNAFARQGVKITMSAMDAAKGESFYKHFTRDGGSMTALSTTDTDFEPGGPMAQLLEGRPVPEQTFYEGHSLKLTAAQFAGQFLLSWVTTLGAKKDLITRGPKLLADSLADTREILFHALLVYGGTALASVPKVGGVPMVNPICGNGKPIFASNHNWRSADDVTWSNILASYVHPTQTGVNQIATQIARWRKPNKQPMMVTVDKLIVPSEFKLLTTVFKKSEKDPLSANNAFNAFNEMVPGGVVVDPWLPSNSDWYATTNQKNQLPQIKELCAPFTKPLAWDWRTLNSGVMMATSFAWGPSVNGGLGLFQVTGDPSNVDVLNSLV